MTVEINPAQFKVPPFRHQMDGVRALVAHDSFALYDDPRTGKSAQVVNAACALFDAGELDTVVVVAPAGARSTWLDDELGEIKVHAWVPCRVFEFHSKETEIWNSASILNSRQERHHIVGNCLTWVVTNYEILRGKDHLKRLISKLRGRKTMLVLDESHYVKSRTAQQTKACRELRCACSRCVLLTGTFGTPEDVWSQFMVMNRAALGKYDNYWLFRATFARMGGFEGKKIIGWQNMDEFHALTRPYILRREKANVLDLPPTIYLAREVALTPEIWKRYKQLREEAIVALGDGSVQLEPNAAVRVMRLSQLTSGHLGGYYQGSDMTLNGNAPEALEMVGVTQDLSSEKLDWCVDYLSEECSARGVIVWCRWRRERERLAALLRAKGFEVHEIYGGQKKAEREAAKVIFNARSPALPQGKKPVVLVGQPEAGGVSLDMAQASEVIRLSNDYNHTTLVQSDDRPHGPGQKATVTYIDVIATGPEGQKTVDAAVVKALRRKDDLSRWTAARWRRELSEI